MMRNATPHVKAGTSRLATAERKAKFVEMYFVHNRNGGAAAVAAGYSARTCYVTASKLLSDPKIRIAIKKRAAELAVDARFSAQDVIASLARAVRFDSRELFNLDGSMKRITDLSEAIAMELEGVSVQYEVRCSRCSKAAKVKNVRVIKIHFPNKLVARDQAMRFFGLYARDKMRNAIEVGGLPPPPVAVTVDFKDSRRKSRE